MWMFNIILYLMFLFNQPVYQEMKAEGYACYGYVAALGNEDPNTPPPCFYDHQVPGRLSARPPR
jgi:hypothetical protein